MWIIIPSPHCCSVCLFINPFIDMKYHNDSHKQQPRWHGANPNRIRTSGKFTITSNKIAVKLVAVAFNAKPFSFGCWFQTFVARRLNATIPWKRAYWRSRKFDLLSCLRFHGFVLSRGAAYQKPKTKTSKSRVFIFFSVVSPSVRIWEDAHHKACRPAWLLGWFQARWASWRINLGELYFYMKFRTWKRVYL